MKQTRGLKSIWFGIWIGLLILFELPSLSFSSELTESNILFRALKDELNRSINELRLENQAKPYYIAYRVKELKEIEIKASFGGLLANNESHKRELFVDLRVGDYQMDNSNFICQTSSSRIIEAERTELPIEDEYFALRQAIWLVTDGTYKKALERLARKRAYFQNKQITDTIPDYTKVKPCSLIEPPIDVKIDKVHLSKELSTLSAILKIYPLIVESFIKFNLKSGTQYFLDTDGAQSIITGSIAGIEVKMKAQAKTGEVIEDFKTFYGRGIEDLNFVEIERSIRACAETLSMKANAKNLEEGYSGPVLFLGEAACELFFQILGKGVSGVRQPVIEMEMIERNLMKENLGLLSNRLNKRVLPEFISVFDDPNLKEYNGIRLVGGFGVDEQGVRGEKVELVKDGRLINFLMCRTPVNKIRETNGHARYYNENYVPRYIGFVSNLIVKSQQGLSEKELIERLKKITRDYGNDYALIITRLRPKESQTLMERYRRFFQGRAKQPPLISAPINLYKFDLNTDSLQLIAGLDFTQISSGILKDIVATGEREYTYNFVYYNDYGDEYPVSVVAPAVLIEEMELIPKKVEREKPVIVPRP